MGYAASRSPDERTGRQGSVGYTRPVTRPAAPAHGWFITIEGPEGAGKTTQADALARHLVDLGLDVHTTREPGGTWLGERLREILLARTDSAAPTDPLTDALLFNAARRQLVTEVIRPALDAGRTVVCARFADSTLAYQGYGAGIPLDRLRALELAATDSLTPDLTILLDVPVEVGLERTRRRKEWNRFEDTEEVAFFERVRAAYLGFAEAEPDRFRIVDGSGSVADSDEAIRNVVAATFGVAQAG